MTRPIQVAFPQEEEIERFGKRRRLTRDDYERLNQSATMPGRPLRLVDEANALSDGGPVINPGDGFFPVGIEDFTEANTNPYYPLRDPRRVSSQPMLLENESLDVNNGVGMQSSLPSTHGVARNASSLSRSSGGLQRRGDRVTTTNPVRMNGEPYISARQWLDQGHTMEASHSNRSSSIVPEPESTVRRRFTIDDQIRDAQAFVDRQRRLPASSSSTFSELVGQGQIEPERPPRMFPGGPPLGIPATLFRPAPQTNGDLDNMTRLSVPGQTFQLLSQFPPSNPSPRPLSSQRPGAVARALTSGQGRLEGPVLGDANESLNVDMNGEADSGEQSDGDNVNDDFYQAYLNL